MTRFAPLLISACLAGLVLPAAAAGGPEPDDYPHVGATVYRSKCLLCHPNSPGQKDGPRYKARRDAVPLWTLYDPGEGWQDSQVGLGHWSDANMKRWLQFPKDMKPGTPMIQVPMEPRERSAVIRYIKHLGRKY